METHNIHNSMIGSRNHRVNLHVQQYRKHMAMKKAEMESKEQYNHKGAGSVTIFLAITTVSFIFYYVMNVIF